MISTCITRELTITKMRGQTVNLVVTAVDQDENSLASFVSAQFK